MVTYAEAADPDPDLSAYPPYWRPYVTYCASKALAERAAWDFVDTTSPSFTLSVINPTYILGPTVPAPAKVPESLSFSNQLIWNTATDESKLWPLDWPSRVDVRDVAKAHLGALTREEAQGKRYLVANQSTTYEEASGAAFLYQHDIADLSFFFTDHYDHPQEIPGT
jgi:NADPH-dependent methylglyoxal reductase